MCSIFGFVAKHKKTVNVDALAEIVRANERRGPHAFGFSWITQDGRLRMWKAPGNPVRMLGMLRMMGEATMVVGHMRYSTHGNPANNINNHPHPCDGGWIVHNGVVHNYARLVSDYRLVMNSQCDSEVIGLLAEASAEPTAMARLLSAVEQTSEGPLAVMGLWNRRRQLVAIRRGNPLHIVENEDGYYLASLAQGMPGPAKDVKIFADNSAVRFTQRGAVIDIESDTVRMAAPRKPKASLFEMTDEELDAMVRAAPNPEKILPGVKYGSRVQPVKARAAGANLRGARPFAAGRGVADDGTVGDDYRGG